MGEGLLVTVIPLGELEIQPNSSVLYDKSNWSADSWRFLADMKFSPTFLHSLSSE